MNVKQVLLNDAQRGFNSTQERFSYMKDMQKMGAVPGPGSYNAAGKTTIASSTQPDKQATVPNSGMKRHALNTISSTGGNGFMRQTSATRQSPSSIKLKNMSPGMFGTVGSHMFKDSTSREDFNHYVPKNTNNTIAL